MKDRVAACNIIPVLVHCENERAYEDTFLHSLISFLIAMSDEFAHDDFCSVVFDDYLLVRTCIYMYMLKNIYLILIFRWLVHKIKLINDYSFLLHF